MAAQGMSWKWERQHRRFQQPKETIIAVNEAELDTKSVATKVRESDTSDFYMFSIEGHPSNSTEYGAPSQVWLEMFVLSRGDLVFTIHALRGCNFAPFQWAVHPE